MSEHHGDGVTRREVLIGAAGGLALAAVERFRSAGAALAGGLKSPASCSRTGTARARPAHRTQGSPAMLVSNGRDVAVTGPDGRYTLPLPEEATIFVIKPAGFMPPIEPLTNLPRFYRHHQPKGSPAELNLTLRGLGADRAFAGVRRFPAAPPGRAQGVQRRAGDRSAAGDRR